MPRASQLDFLKGEFGANNSKWQKLEVSYGIHIERWISPGFWGKAQHRQITRTVYVLSTVLSSMADRRNNKVSFLPSNAL